MDNSRSGKPDWQAALEHHEDLCTERYKGIEKRLDNIEKLQRITIGGIFAMPAILFALLKLF